MSFSVISLSVRPEHIPRVITEHTGVVLGYELLSQSSYSVLQRTKGHRRPLKRAGLFCSIVTERC